jgi:dihydroflavonol-4-reductase
VPYPVAFGAAAMGMAMARVTGREPFTTLDGVRMSRKKMYFSSEKARGELSYRPRPACEAIADGVGWFAANDYLKA